MFLGFLSLWLFHCGLLVSMMQRLSVFEQLGASEHYRSQMLSIGCGVGIAASFGAPFGGTNFTSPHRPFSFISFSLSLSFTVPDACILAAWHP
jgi:hypothetical protein